MNDESMREFISRMVHEYYREFHAQEPFVPGTTHVPVTQKYYDSAEMNAIVSSALDFNLTSGRFVESFEKKLSTYVGTRYALTTNSGSSANLLAVLSASESQNDADEPRQVITMAAGFPTTVAPIYQAGMIPHFVDITLPTYSVNVDQVNEAVNHHTVGMILAHTLGNPFDLDSILAICEEHGLWLVEDCCDALGSEYYGRKVGSFGRASTLSFYPAHQITCGEGGAVLLNDPRLARVVESYRDWGRDCWCETGHDATCGKRYTQQFGTLPFGYDHKYVYTRLGYNLKMTEMQAAIGDGQMDKLDWFVTIRRKHFAQLLAGLGKYEGYFILPEETSGATTSWFGFPLTIRRTAPFNRPGIIDYLDRARIDSRLLFAGNMTRQPVLEGAMYVAEDLAVSDKIMNDTFWLGVHPSLTTEMIDYMIETIGCFIKEL